MAARRLDQDLHRLEKEGLDIHAVRQATVRVPMPPMGSEEPTVTGYVNDSLQHGGSLLPYVQGGDHDIERAIPRLLAGGIADSGEPVAQIYEEHESDVRITDLRFHSQPPIQGNYSASDGGFSAGDINRAILGTLLGTG